MRPAETYRISRRAQADLQEIWDYIARDSAETADRFLDKLFARFLKLTEFPQIGRCRDELVPGLRGCVFRKYIIFYRTVDDVIEIYRVLHGARDIEGIFAQDRRAREP